MVDWMEKYCLLMFFEVCGNNKVCDVFVEWVKMWDDYWEVVVVYGSLGIGKIFVVYVFVVDMGWEMVELNVLDQWIGDVIECFVGCVVKNVMFVGFFVGMFIWQLVIFDEVDNIYGNYDCGGVSVVICFVKLLSQFIVFIVNEFYDMSCGFWNVCQEIEFCDVFVCFIVFVFCDICCKEGLEFEFDVFDCIVEMNSGDFWLVVNDF